MDPRPLEMRDYLSILWTRKWTVMAIGVTTIATALAYSFQQTPVYTSSTEVIVLPVSFDPDVPSGAAIAPNMRKEEQVANSEPVERQASLSLAARDLTAGEMLISQVEDADTLVFTSSAPDRRAAQATAEAYAGAYLELRRRDLVDELQGAREPYESAIEAIDAELDEIARALETAQGEAQVRLDADYSRLLSERATYLAQLIELATPENVRVGRVLRSAALPRLPSAPNHVRNGLLALLVGLALGIGVALFRDRLDERIRGRQELEHLSEAPVLAFIPRSYSSKTQIPIALSRPESEAAEAFKSLVVRLLHATKERATTIVITSSLAGEGKTWVTANLGVTLALAGKRVVIVSADLRKPRLHNYFQGSDFGGAGGAGLTEVLRGQRKRMEALSTTDTKNLWVIHAGGRADSPASELLGSRSMIDLLADLRDFADIVLIDTPPLLTTSDVIALAPLTDGVLFVVDPHYAHRSDVEQARHELELIGVSVIGVVVNKHNPRHFRPYGTGYRYYGDGYERSSANESPRALRAIPADPELRTTIPPSDRDTGDHSRP